MSDRLHQKGVSRIRNASLAGPERLWAEYKELLEEAGNLVTATGAESAERRAMIAEHQARLWRLLATHAPADPWRHAAVRIANTLKHSASALRSARG